ncbi:MAG: serine/threonine-protein kinase PknK [Sandaracinaceae bacterium]
MTLPDRYGAGRVLGRGGMGTVVRARDRERDRDVAVKILLDSSPAGLLALKREFRALAGLAHRNLVLLLELNTSHSPPFLAMELVDGPSFFERFGGAAPERKRAAAIELLTGLAQLHAHGVRHGDIKPENVLVDRDDRVVMVDFGLASSAIGLAESDDGPGGTPAYLAPELLLGSAPTLAADLFSAGVLLYETAANALLGSRERQRLITRRLPHPRELGVDEELADLIWEMLDPDPDRRPTAADALARAEGRRGLVAEVEVFVGRSAERAAILDAFSRARRGATHVAIEGASGIGKTSLARHALRELSERGAAVLVSRCHPHEETPFQAFDGLVDNLVRVFQSRPPAELALDADVADVGLAFPVFRVLAPPSGRSSSPSAQRARLVRGLRRALRHAGGDGALVLWIDDAHWADPDSLRLLEDVLAPPEEPRVLLVTTARPHLDTDGQSDALGSIVEPTRRIGLTLGALDGDHARELLARLGPELSENEIEDQITSAAGDPFRLVSAAALAVGELDDRMTETERRMLQRVAVAGRPLGLDELARGLALEDPLGALQSLEGRRLLARDRAGLYTAYHDRRLAPLVAELDEQQIRDTHAALADGLIESGSPSPAQLIRHLELAGRGERALPYVIRGVAAARETLAFERSVSLLQVALRYAPPEERDGLLRQLAEALALSGRGFEAGELYEELSTRAESGAAARLEQLACEQFLFSGHHERGADVARRVLARAGTKLARNELLAFAELMYLDKTKELRLLEVVPPTAEPSADELARLDVLHAVALGLSFAQPIQSALLAYRHVRGAVRLGEASRAARALGMYMVSAAIYRYAPERSAEVRRRAIDLAERSGSVESRALVTLAAAGADWAEGRFADCVAQLEEDSEALARDEPGLRWHRDTWQLVRLEGQLCLGRYAEVARGLPEGIADARARGDLHLEINLLARVAPILWLARDRPDRARRCLADVVDRWPSTGAGTVELLTCLNATKVAMYEGAPDVAWSVLSRGWRAADRAFLFSMAFHKTLAWPLRARVALAAASRGQMPVRRAVREAHRALRQLEPCGPVAAAEACAVRAELAAVTGDRPGLVRALEDAARRYEALEMHGHLAATHDTLSALDGSAEVDLERWDELGVRAPERFSRLVVGCAAALRG